MTVSTTPPPTTPPAAPVESPPAATPPPAAAGAPPRDAQGRFTSGEPAATPPAAPSGRSIVGDAAQPPAWLTRLPTELQGEVALRAFADETALARGYLEAREATEGLVRIPGKDTPAEEVAAFRKAALAAFGVPETPEGYALAKPEQLPRGMVWRDEEATEFAQLAHAEGIPPATVQKLMAFEMKRHEGRLALLEQARTDGEAALRKEWGGEYDAKTAAVARAIDHLAPDPAERQELLDFLDLSGFGSRPNVVRALAWVGELLAENVAEEGDGAAAPANAQDAELRARYPTMFGKAGG